ncbi:MAG: hypothetical protein KatS3mg102_1695 [Planctomycetota bacterium]|nr:MAG: hypothetical protein KatS3mg102_1695 [Planctomycetota bacterium]
MSERGAASGGLPGVRELGWAGFTDPASARRRLERLAAAAPGGEAVRRCARRLVSELAATGAPDRGLANLERWSEALAEPGRWLAAIVGSPPQRRTLLALAAESRLYAEALAAAPEMVAALAAGAAAQPRAQPALRARLASARTPAELFESWRLALLEIGWRDVVRGQPFAWTAQQLSQLAEAAVEAALAQGRARAARRHPVLAPGGAAAQRAGSPPQAQPLPFCVIALGKLGGSELNFSSDIDLLFCHDEDWPPARAAPGGPAEVFGALGREILAVLAGGEQAPRLYRVDLRLRPEGSRGPVSVGVGSAVRYYQSRGRTWERQALLKARPIAGDLALGQRLLRALEPFVHRGYLNVQAIADIQALKRQLEARARPRGDDIKEGPGGLRDLEFAVQFLQLLHGPERPELRVPGTLEAIARLVRAGCLGRKAARRARAAYCWLRLVEHRLMTAEGQRLHRLPEDSAGQRALAGRLGLGGPAGPARMVALLARHRRRAQQLLERSLHGLFREATSDQLGAEASDLVLDPAPPPERIARVLAAYGFRDPAAAYRELERLATQKGRFGEVAPRTRALLASLAPRLLAAIAACPDPDGTLARLERTVATLGAKGAFYQLLHHEPDALALFVRLASDSPHLNELLRRNPGLTDEVVDLLLTRAELDTERALERMRAAHPESPLEGIRAVHRTALLLAGLRDLGGRLNLANLSAALTALAEAVLRRVMELVLAEAEQRWGALPDGAWLAVLGAGTLGGGELGYGSDLDLVLCWGGAAELSGGERLELAERMERSGQLFMRRMEELALYDVDVRLRPEGGAGALVAPAEQLVHYYCTGGRAEVWERLAASRLRAVAGELAAGAEVVRAIQDAIYAAPPAELAAQTRAMRARLEQAAAGPDDLKRGPGGLLDIDFACAFLRLRCRGSPPAVRAPGTVAALRALAAAGHLATDAFIDLLTGYQLLRTVELRLRLREGRRVCALPLEPAARRALARSLGYVDTRRRTAEDAMLQELAHTRRRVRARFEQLVR